MSSAEEVLRTVSFGERVAEAELDSLRRYFVKTDQWSQIIAGEKDLVFGIKGAGKSAIYSLLVQSSEALSELRTVVIAAEKPQGLPVFAAADFDPPDSEEEWRALWRAYFLCLVDDVLQREQITVPAAVSIHKALVEQGLTSSDGGIEGLLRAARNYSKAIARIESIEAGIAPDPITGLVVATGRIGLREPSNMSAAERALAVTQLLCQANAALDEADLNVWIALDRLDVAFQPQSPVEKDALRALLRVYLDIQGLARITPKIFLRTDIWDQITDAGFREASHLTRLETIQWNRDSLLDLVVRRLVENDAIRARYSVSEATVLAGVQEREQLFYRVFPDQVEGGQNQTPTLEWMISRTRDGLGRNTPRELIHLLGCLREQQLARFQLGHSGSDDDRLFERATFRAALDTVSQTRLTQTLYAESPKLKPFIRAFEGGSTSYQSKELATLWNVTSDEARDIVDALIDVGFFERRGGADVDLGVPFLYRPALRLGTNGN
jgi:hypothetical protein